MKRKWIAVCMAAVTLLSLPSQALAHNFTGELGNEATFETLQEAHANSVEVVSGIVENDTKVFTGHPALDGYPEGTTYVYRSANQYAGRAAARLNTNIFVYAEESFEDADAAKAYLEGLGLIDIIDEAVGSIVLVTPVGETFDLADVASYYALQTAMLAQKDGVTDADGNSTFYSDAEYFGGYGYVYFVGIDGGATFFNNYIAPEIDFVGRLAGALLIGGDMQKVRKPATFVPMYLVNSKDEVVQKYCAADGTDTTKIEKGRTTYYNQLWPLRRVITVEDEAADAAAMIHDAYYDLFVKAMRVPVLPQALYSGGAPFAGYNFDEAPYSLCDRHALIQGKTVDGIVYVPHQGEDRFSDIAMENGEYLDVWYEYLPEEVLDGSAPDGTIPLILANHGGGDDARVFVEEFGLLELAADERVAIVAADHQSLASPLREDAFIALVEYMLDEYPALDASRVYATGYSWGGGATYSVGYVKPELFAAIAPFAGSAIPMAEEYAANFDNIDLPTIMSISAFDPPPRRLAALEGDINEAEQDMVKTWTSVNGIELADFDFEAYPYFGQEADELLIDTVNDEFTRYTWTLNNADGEPRYAFTYVFDMIHALYPEYAFIGWDFMKHFSRDLETGAVIYDPYVS